jgi:hypothetical protein
MNELAELTFPPANEDCAASSTASGFDIRESITHHVGVRQGQSKVVCGFLEHPDPRLSAATASPERFQSGVWMV